MRPQPPSCDRDEGRTRGLRRCSSAPWHCRSMRNPGRDIPACSAETTCGNALRRPSTLCHPRRWCPTSVSPEAQDSSRVSTSRNRTGPRARPCHLGADRNSGRTTEPGLRMTFQGSALPHRSHGKRYGLLETQRRRQMPKFPQGRCRGRGTLRLARIVTLALRILRIGVGIPCRSDPSSGRLCRIFSSTDHIIHCLSILLLTTLVAAHTRVGILQADSPAKSRITGRRSPSPCAFESRRRAHAHAQLAKRMPPTVMFGSICVMIGVYFAYTWSWLAKWASSSLSNGMTLKFLIAES